MKGEGELSLGEHNRRGSRGEIPAAPKSGGLGAETPITKGLGLGMESRSWRFVLFRKEITSFLGTFLIFARQLTQEINSRIQNKTKTWHRPTKQSRTVNGNEVSYFQQSKAYRPAALPFSFECVVGRLFQDQQKSTKLSAFLLPF